MKFAQEGASEFAPIEIELYNKALPKTCENFLKLCQGVEGWVDEFYNMLFSILKSLFSDQTAKNGVTRTVQCIESSQMAGFKAVTSPLEAKGTAAAQQHHQAILFRTKVFQSS